MAGRENQAQQVVAYVIVEGFDQVRCRGALLSLELMAKLRVLSLEQLVATERINRPMLRGSHEPGAGVPWYAGHRPLLECGNERILREILCETDIAHDPNETGNESG